MCDENTYNDNLERFKKKGFTRRQFNQMTITAAMITALPPVANACDVTKENVTISTPDGEADCYFVRPTTGKAPGVIMWPDIMGLRDAFRAMSTRLAQSGYAVLVPNPFYRTAKAPVFPEGTGFKPGPMTVMREHATRLNPTAVLSDGAAYIQFLDDQPSVDSSRKIGTAGYCMSGSFTLRMAAAFPDRIGAAGSFHGTGLASDSDNSPHLLAPKIKSGVLIAIAESDDEKEPEAKVKLREAFAKAGTKAEIEVYAGAGHGWCPPDTPSHVEEYAERAWARLLVLFEKNLV